VYAVPAAAGAGEVRAPASSCARAAKSDIQAARRVESALIPALIPLSFWRAQVLAYQPLVVNLFVLISDWYRRRSPKSIGKFGMPIHRQSDNIGIGTPC
jgi:hypothetical protein